MRGNHRLASVVIVLLASAWATAASAHDVYLLAGQSNMDGRGKAAELSEEQRQPFDHVIIFYRNPPFSSEGWKPLAPGYSVAPGFRGSTLPSTTFGPEIGFARALIKSQPNRSLALIKASKGGTSLAKDWNPGVRNQPGRQGACYSNFIATVALAMKALSNDGSTPTLRGLLWHQGEGDAAGGSSAEVYQQRLTTFIARVREDLGQPDLPVVVGEVFDNGKRDSVRAAQRAVAAKERKVAFVAASDLKTSDAGTHFDTASQLILGARFAEAMAHLAASANGAKTPELSVTNRTAAIQDGPGR
jgi:iduronate 2-sulfatase